MESLPSEYASLLSDGEKRDAGRGAGSEAKASETPRPQEAREQPADPMPSVVSLLLQARGQDPFRAATLVLEMAQKTAEARLQESERLAAQIAKDAEATIARAQLDLEARRKAFDEDLVRRERAFAEDLDRRSKAQEAVLAARSAELDQKARALEQQTSAAQKDLEERRRQHDARVSAELEANRQKMAAAQKELDEQRERYESRMSAELEAHRNRITAESTQHQQLLAKERAEFREQLRREAEVQAKVFDVQQAALARDLQLSQGLVQERQAQAKALLDTADLTSGTLLKLASNVERQADLVSALAQPREPAQPRVSGIEVAGNVTLGLLSAVKELGVAAITSNPRVAKALEGPLGVAKGLAESVTDAAKKSGFDPTPAETLAPSKPESDAALRVPLSALNDPAVLAQLEAKFGKDGWASQATLADLVELARSAAPNRTGPIDGT